jgi:hypothetical protein
MITYELVEELLRTNSPNERLKIILNHIRELTPDEVEKLNISISKSLIEKQRQGKEYALRRAYSKKKSLSYPHPKCFTDYKGGYSCSTCREIILPPNIFKHKVNNIYSYWHCLPECFPIEYEIQMLNDKDYIRIMRIINEKEE